MRIYTGGGGGGLTVSNIIEYRIRNGVFLFYVTKQLAWKGRIFMLLINCIIAMSVIYSMCVLKQ